MTPHWSSSRALAWTLVVLWGLAIVGLGSDSFSHSRTAHILDAVYRWLLPGLSDATRAQAIFYTRKLAHVVEYGVFGLLAHRAMLVSTRVPLGFAVAAALALCAGLASLDELKQSFSPVRTGSALDVVIDVAGAAIALASLLALQRALDRSLIQTRSGAPSYWPRSAASAPGPGSGESGAR